MAAFFKIFHNNAQKRGGVINTIKIVYPYKEGFVLTEDNVILKIPENWAFLPSGDPGVTRKITSHCDCFRVQIKKGRRIISTGLWTFSDSIEQAKADVEKIRATDVYKKNQINSKYPLFRLFVLTILHLERLFRYRHCHCLTMNIRCFLWYFR